MFRIFQRNISYAPCSEYSRETFDSVSSKSDTNYFQSIQINFSAPTIYKPKIGLNYSNHIISLFSLNLGNHLSLELTNCNPISPPERSQWTEMKLDIPPAETLKLWYFLSHCRTIMQYHFTLSHVITRSNLMPLMYNHTYDITTCLFPWIHVCVYSFSGKSLRGTCWRADGRPGQNNRSLTHWSLGEVTFILTV